MRGLVLLLIMVVMGICVFGAESEWTKRYFVDEFEEPTEAFYYQTTVEGSFSNTATTNSLLLVSVIVNEDNEVSFSIYEYGSVKSVGNGDSYDIAFKGSSSGVVRDTGKLYTRMYFDAKSKIFFNSITESDNTKIIITDSNVYSHTKYIFSVPQLIISDLSVY